RRQETPVGRSGGRGPGGAGRRARQAGQGPGRCRVCGAAQQAEGLSGRAGMGRAAQRPPHHLPGLHREQRTGNRPQPHAPPARLRAAPSGGPGAQSGASADPAAQPGPGRRPGAGLGADPVQPGGADPRRQDRGSHHVRGAAERAAHRPHRRARRLSAESQGRLLAVSDLHVTFAENREFVASLRPGSPHDWLIVAGDVAEKAADIEWALGTLRSRFAAVVWVPGNHELWTLSTDPVRLRGQARYQYLVSACRRLGVLTPEDPFAVWRGAGGPVVIVPVFALYDYTFRPGCAATKAEALALAYETGIVCSDEAVLHPDPYPSREAWCQARIEATERRLAALPPGIPTILVSHFPLTREPTRVLRYPEFAQWCGTERTADWHLRFGALA